MQQIIKEDGSEAEGDQMQPVRAVRRSPIRFACTS